ncbi:anthranilate/para-aminobenzoate synthase component I [Owenweeksia hongkongensis DSM 17368]|uniref:Anthranilate/para-aminobenzoate synthase component I n=1 Tax=Owenweeksia hongkongensis (strain DSM 17368 / CIP 108786 / JCM 12287 / NRRL B-23963 / UST20020801) TaxID=926562 RepID=G8R164_OWEHD|nr:anthranilate synthase component I family protein [Owenweeksia hongkongensis]AEV32779.1 anthranilate/para-aminobenzoate synthase component I [Owenweeksia hongkongensis DSM 17368]
MRHKFPLPTQNVEELKSALLHWCGISSHSSFLDSNHHHDKYSQYDWLVAIGAHQTISPSQNYFAEQRAAFHKHEDWLFGHLSYDLKNSLENLSTQTTDTIGFSPMLFYIPKIVVYSKAGEILVESLEHKSADEFYAALPAISNLEKSNSIRLQPKTKEAEYLRKVASLKEHLQFGNIYEVNYCIEFSTQTKDFLPISAFENLNKSASAPFSAFYKNADTYLICASPERYIQKTGNHIISQPIKGTIRRDKNPEMDAMLKIDLYNNEKERSENVMITDLVRNDLSQTAKRGTVKVDELFGIYTFNTVHQMISTVSSTLDDQYDLTDVLQTSFPMGSMTGAPKIKAMELIDEHENFARNLYAGSVGYIDPKGNFDFNVVIRSLFYNANTSYLSARVGSAITIHCDAKKEYEECLLKAENLFAALR